MRTRLCLVATLAVVALACGDSPPAAPEPAATPTAAAILRVVPTAAPAQTVVTPAATAAPAQAVAAPTATPPVQRDVAPVGDVQSASDSTLDSLSPEAQEARDQLGGGSALVGRLGFGLLSLEEAILESDTIARVSLLSSTTSVATVEHSPEHVALLEFRLEVHEYLKGSGPNEIGALVGANYYTAADAEWARTLVAAAHDTRWDDRQAIVFLNYPEPGLEVPELGAGQYWLADVGGALSGYLDMYTVASPWNKLWLPEARQTAGRSLSEPGRPEPVLFMLDVPSGTPQGARSSAAASGPTISLSDLKSRIATLETEASTGGTPEYRDCVEYYYNYRRKVASNIAINGRAPWRFNRSIEAGLPAGTVVYERTLPSFSWTGKPGPKWFEGPDKDLMEFNLITVATSTEGWAKYRTQQVTTRPLPAGSYTYHANGLSSRSEGCGKDWSFSANRSVTTLTVTLTSDRTLHEAFFDPVAIATAVGADNSNGVLEPTDFALDTTTTTISSLKWEDGAVTMTLSPTASLADYAVDVIDVNGTTTLSLTSDNASTTPLTWTVTDKPWSDGDLLMLRIHKPISTDATLSNLALSGIDLTFSTATTTYTASVPATTTQTTVTPTTNHASASYVVKLGGVADDDGTIPLAAGENLITIDVTAEDAVTTRTYSITIARATPSAPVTVTLIPRVNGLTFFDIDIQWNYSGSCENYLVAITTATNYQISFLGFHPPETSSHYVEGGWLYDDVPDFWVVVECRTSGQTQEVGRASLRAAHPDNN